MYSQPYHLPSQSQIPQQSAMAVGQQYAYSGYQIPQYGNYMAQVVAKPQPVTSTYQKPSVVAPKVYEKPKPKRYTQEEVEQRVQEIQGKSKLTNQIHLLIRNLRVLEVLQR